MAEPMPPTVSPPVGDRPKTLAIVSLICGIVGLLPCLDPTGGWICLVAAIAAIVVGVMALNRIKAGEQSGRGMAIAGIILGCIALLLTILMILVALGLIAAIGFLGWQAGESTFENGAPAPADPDVEPMGLLLDSAQMLYVYARAFVA